MRAFATAQGSITEDEFIEYTADLNLQIEHLQLLISSVEDELAAHEGERLAAASTEAWLLALRERLEEVDADTKVGRATRRELVQLLVERITVASTEDGQIQVLITYRFGPPEEGFEEDGSHGVSDTLVFAPAAVAQMDDDQMMGDQQMMDDDMMSSPMSSASASASTMSSASASASLMSSASASASPMSSAGAMGDEMMSTSASMSVSASPLPRTGGMVLLPLLPAATLALIAGSGIAAAVLVRRNS